MARVAIAISGGVDSSVAAVLLKQQGHEVIGLHMKLYNGPENVTRQKSCCSLDEALDARAACQKLDIPFYVIDFQHEFKNTVINYFIDEYSNGRTPNPCVMCNKKIKSDFLLKKVDELGFDFLATGHYARVSTNESTGLIQLAKPRDLHKDQTYFLHGIKPEELKKMLFPLAGMIKTEVRQIAMQFNLTTANKPDSQEICFVPKDYRNFLDEEMTEKPVSGDFINLSGEILGKHRGIQYYTIGQRRGLGISDSTPYYVIQLEKDKNQVVLGKETDLLSQTIHVSGVNWVSIPPPEKEIRVIAKLRYSHVGVKAMIIPESNTNVRIKTDEPVRAVSPGQAAVFYQDNILLGGGWIDGSNQCSPECP